MAKYKNAETPDDLKGGLGLGVRRTIAYVVLIIISILCLFWFYVLFINATRIHDEIQSGFSAIPGGAFLDNLNHLIHGTQPVFNGLFNSVLVA